MGSFLLTDFTNGGNISLYVENTTSIDERWHFYHDIAFTYLDFASAQRFCGNFGAHLLRVKDEEEHQRVISRVKVR